MVRSDWRTYQRNRYRRWFTRRNAGSLSARYRRYRTPGSNGLTPQQFHRFRARRARAAARIARAWRSRRRSLSYRRALRRRRLHAAFRGGVYVPPRRNPPGLVRFVPPRR